MKFIRYLYILMILCVEVLSLPLFAYESKSPHQWVLQIELLLGGDDYTLLVSEKARKYAIIKELDQQWDCSPI